MKVPGFIQEDESIIDLITDNINEYLTIPLQGWERLHELLDFICRDEIKIPKECLAEAFFDNGNEFEGLDHSKSPSNPSI